MQNEISEKILIYNSQLIDNNQLNKFYADDGKFVYEVIRIINRIPLFVEDHLMRLHFSANLAGFNLNISDSQILNSILQLVHENQVDNGNIKILIQFHENQLTSFYCYFINHNYPTEIQYKNGVKVKLFSSERSNPNAKILNKKLRHQTDTYIHKNSIYEVLLVNRNGWITEGSKSNVFFIKGNLIFTAPKSMILPGITRQYVLKSAHLSFFEVIEECVNKSDINIYDAAFISGTSPKILAINSIDDITFDVNNKVLQKIVKDYNNEIEKYLMK